MPKVASKAMARPRTVIGLLTRCPVVGVSTWTVGVARGGLGFAPQASAAAAEGAAPPASSARSSRLHKTPRRRMVELLSAPGTMAQAPSDPGAPPWRQWHGSHYALDSRYRLM